MSDDSKQGDDFSLLASLLHEEDLIRLRHRASRYGRREIAQRLHDELVKRFGFRERGIF